MWVSGACDGQNRVLNPLELELWMMVVSYQTDAEN